MKLQGVDRKSFRSGVIPENVTTKPLQSNVRPFQILLISKSINESNSFDLSSSHDQSTSTTQKN